MTITDVQSFLEYYEKVRERTLKVIVLIPHDKLEWTYKQGKFTLGDLVRHIAAIERHMYAEAVQGKPSRYNGCGPELASGYNSVLEHFNTMHKESVEIFKHLSAEDLNKKCLTPARSPITTWKWLRAMVEHEIHHRGQLYIYLGMLNIPTAPIFGLTSEEVIAKGLRPK